ncbi:hypothetical protein [Actinomadura hibisca]|uniref:hypothetical protein n=1 Tax=Actinomadura hibisca TaxID=68565 RepID=UPI000A048C8C|nr:hypothetical protein [Actinomadura hibisca]
MNEAEAGVVHRWNGPRAARTPEELRDRWRAASREMGWSVPGDWWAPAVESVVAAACGGRGMAVACARLGQARGRAGVAIGETLDDLGALFSVLRWPDPPLSLVRCAAEGWVDSGLLELVAESCEDPLTGLMTPSYLRSRLTELYRGAAALGGAPGTAAADTHRLVLVDLPDGVEPWRRLARAIVVAHDLRAVFAGGETLSLVGAGRAAALAAAGPRLEAEVAELRRLLDAGRAGCRVRVEPLPDTLQEARELLEALAC